MKIFLPLKNLFEKLLLLDEKLYLKINNLPHPKPLNRFFLVFDYLTYGGIAALIFFLFLIGFGKKKLRKVAWGSLGSVLFTTLVGELILKTLILRRKRAHLALGADIWALDPKTFSFPSGQTAGTFGLIFFLLPLIQNPFLKTGLLGFGLVVAVSRVYLGAHYPLDALGGIFIGSICGLLFYKIFPPLK